MESRTLDILKAGHKVCWQLVFASYVPEFASVKRSNWFWSMCYRTMSSIPVIGRILWPLAMVVSRVLNSRLPLARQIRMCASAAGVKLAPAQTIQDYQSLPDVDLCIVDSWDIVPPEYLIRPKFGCLCIHPSDLPQYRGSLPNLAALRDGRHEVAVSFFELSPGIDDGTIFRKVPLLLDAGDDWFDFEQKIGEAVAANLPKLINEVVAGLKPTLKQDGTKATSTPQWSSYRQIKPDKETVAEVCNKVAFYPWFEPGVFCWIKIGDQTVVIRSCFPIPHAPQRAFEVTKRGMMIRLLDGAILVPAFRGIGLIEWMKLTRQLRVHDLSYIKTRGVDS